MAASLYATTTRAQVENTDSSGLYLSTEDYVKGVLSYPGARIRADIPFRHAVVKVAGETAAKEFRKDEVYGYRDERGQDYRFVGNKAYKIVDKAYFPLYRRVEIITKGKERTREPRYYFSTRPGDALQALTIRQLKKAFPDNRRFHYLLDLQFKHDRELVAYDDIHQEYKVKTIFSSAIQDKSIVQGE